MSAPVAILAIGDMSFRERIRSTLIGLRWTVLEACGGADALSQLESGTTSTIIMDHWFPDLDVREFVREVESSFPDVDLISTDGSYEKPAKLRNNRHGELLYALRINQGLNGPHAPTLPLATYDGPEYQRSSLQPSTNLTYAKSDGAIKSMPTRILRHGPTSQTTPDLCSPPNSDLSRLVADGSINLPEFIGSHPVVLEMCRRIRLVAKRNTQVLIQGPSGTGKELVARALHRLSLRRSRPFVAVNCAAIPESLLESEMFGHAKGSFTGASQHRVGRVEAASGGTLFLDEIGEMSLPIQAKLLRFLESGEIQRIGDNETIYVDARIIAASNQELAQLSSKAAFRSDLFYRLAVFLIETPPLKSHMEDLPIIANFFLDKLLEQPGSMVLSPAALEKLNHHAWPGNVRELAHVIERSFILADGRSEISDADIEFAGGPPPK